MKKVNIASGWSYPGGSTLHHIGLTNLLNDNGYDCTFYGPHDWHIGQCRSGYLDRLDTNEDATLIAHFLYQNIPPSKHRILSLHETNLYPLDKFDDGHWDTIQFVSQHQKEWHENRLGRKINGVIIPPRIERITW